MSDAFITRSVRFPAAVYAAIEREKAARAAAFSATSVSALIVSACADRYLNAPKEEDRVQK